MSIASYVEGLRQKPEHIRKKAAFWWALCLTLIVAAGYVVSFDLKDTATRASAAAVAEKVSSPGASMTAAVGDLAESIWERIVGPKKVEFSEVTVLPGKN